MTTLTLIEDFFRGAEKGNASGGRLYIEGDKLINYGTCLVENKNGIWYLNMTKYSPTTSKHQNRIKRELPYGSEVIELTDIPMGTSTLSNR